MELKLPKDIADGLDEMVAGTKEQSDEAIAAICELAKENGWNLLALSNACKSVSAACMGTIAGNYSELESLLEEEEDDL